MSPLTLRVGGYAPEDTAHGAGLAAFRDAVEDGSAGSVRVEIMWNILDTGRPASDLFDLVETGELFLCYFSSSYLGSRVPDLNVIEVPYLFKDLDHAHRVLDGPLGDRLIGAVEAVTGFSVLGFWDNGFRHFTNRLRPVRHPDDTRGMTVRLQPNVYHEEMVRSWGAVPIAVELSKGIELITTLAVDAQENPLANTVAYGVDGVHRHITMSAHLYGARGLFAHRATLEALDPAIALVVRTAARAAVIRQRVAAEEGERRLRTRLESQGIEFIDLTDSERAAFIDASAPAIERARRELGDELLGLVDL